MCHSELKNYRRKYGKYLLHLEQTSVGVNPSSLQSWRTTAASWKSPGKPRLEKQNAGLFKGRKNGATTYQKPSEEDQNSYCRPPHSHFEVSLKGPTTKARRREASLSTKTLTQTQTSGADRQCLSVCLSTVCLANTATMLMLGQEGNFYLIRCIRSLCFYWYPFLRNFCVKKLSLPKELQVARTHGPWGAISCPERYGACTFVKATNFCSIVFQ